MVDKKKLAEVLSRYPGGVETVRVSEGRDLVVTVVSESFRGCNEAVRQERIWNFLYDELDADDVHSIEFIFTNAPGEDTSEAAA